MARPQVKLPAVIFAGSFLCLMCVALLFSAAGNVILIAIFFVLILSILISGGLTLGGLAGPVGPRSRQAIIVVSIFTVILLMFRSAHSLGVVDLLILVLTTAGISFYLRRRL